MWLAQALLPEPILPANSFLLDQPTLLVGKTLCQVDSAGAGRLQLILAQGVQLGAGVAVVERHQVQVRAVAIQACHQLVLFQVLVNMKQAQCPGFARHLQAQVINQLQ
ncbi:hypothetical protein D3C85_626140 [compost metagenome]